MLDAGMQNTLQFPSQVLREAYAAELIDDEGVWLDMLNTRNQTSHIYDDHTAAVIAAKIQERLSARVAKARRAVGRNKNPAPVLPNTRAGHSRQAAAQVLLQHGESVRCEEESRGVPRSLRRCRSRTGEAFVPSTYKQPRSLTSTPMS